MSVSSYCEYTVGLTCYYILYCINIGLKACAHIWYEVVLELRHRWESGILIPRYNCTSGIILHGVLHNYYRLKDEPPDLFCCLLHQKLQVQS